MRKLLASTFCILLSSQMSIALGQEDSRKAINLTESERNLVLAEMRTFLDTVRSITVSLSRGDMQSLAKAAKSVGMAASGEVPPELSLKLPLEFKLFAMKTHKAFDQIALDAIDMEDKQQTLEQLGNLMGNCVACHAIYRLPVPKE